MSSSYRTLLARTGARTLALSCALGWLSFSSYGLAIVLAVEAATGSFAVAGAAIGAFSAGSALLVGSAALRLLVACEVALGITLGALEVAAPAIAARDGAAAPAALPRALFALGSVATSRRSALRAQ